MSKQYPPSDKKLQELRQADIFPRSAVLESTAALFGAVAVVWATGEGAVRTLKLFASGRFAADGVSGAEILAQFQALMIFVILVIFGAVTARLLVIKGESRLFIRWPVVQFGRVFGLPENLAGYFSRTKRGLLFVGLLIVLFAVIVFVVLRQYDFNNLPQNLGLKPLLVPAVVLTLLGIVELFRNAVLFGSRYGMTREELIAEQQEMRPELRSEIQGRLSDV